MWELGCKDEFNNLGVGGVVVIVGRHGRGLGEQM